jgi:multidrug efflux pump subunit AcrA (membrane-fusion protein)
MGQDPAYAPFHTTLLGLLQDPMPMVRRNAALSLASFQDAAGRPELMAMLRPHAITSPAAGVIKYRLKMENYVNPGTLVGRVNDVEVRSPLPGEVRVLSIPDGSRVEQGDPLVEISPDKDHVWEALRALFVVGDKQDLEEIQRYARGVPGMPDRLQRQASLTANAIQSRGR